MSITRLDSLRQRGFVIVAAIFILVVLAALGGYIVSTSSTQNLSLAQDAMNSRALQAARASLEWATYEVTHASTFRTNCEDVNAGYTGSTPATEVFAAGDLAGLGEFRVDVSCRSQSFDEAGGTYRVYQLVTTACTAAAGCPAASLPAIGYVEHRQTAMVR